MLQTRFDYGFGGQFTPTHPPRPWTPIDETIGGKRVAAAGVPAAYVVRRDSLVELTLRLEEDEWLELVNLIDYGQQGESITWYPDASDLLTSYEVYLEEPAPGGRYAPTRADYLRIFETTIVLRGVDLPPWPNFFDL